MNPICQASYSNVPVWVQSINGVSLMRRQHDGWVNATHLLKIANFDKPRRTRILERDVQSGVHEKVQGGYGKYQGTWVPVERAADLARDFGIYDDVSAMLDYVDDGRNELPQAPTISNKRSSATNAAAQAANTTPARRGRKSASLPSRQPPARMAQPPPAQPTKSINLPPQPQVHNQQHQQQYIPNQSQAHIGGLYAGVVPIVNSPQQFYSEQSQSQSQSQQQPQLSQQAMPNYYPQISHPYQQMAPSRPQHTASSSSGGYSSSEGESDGEWSQLVRTQSRGPSRASGDNSKAAGEDHAVDSPLSASVPNSQGRAASSGQPSAGATQYANTLLNYFMAPNKNDILELLRRPHPDFLVNEVIDSEGHTPFHWAAAMGLIAVMEALIALNANPMALNYAGKTPLARAVHFTNNYDLRSFPRVLDLLSDSLFHVEPQGETLLHSIAFTAASRSKIPSARYYLEQSLARMTELRGPNYVHQFMSRQNASGDTALHLAARNGARKLVRVFLRNNAPREIPNRSGRTANDYILEYEASRRPQQPPHPQLHQQHQQQQQPQQHQHQHQQLHQQQYQHHQQLQQHQNQHQNHIQQQHRQQIQQQAHLGSSTVVVTSGEKRRRRPGLGALANGLPHASEAAIQATQQVAATLAEHLEELAQSYDDELETKDSDIEQVRQLLKQVKEHTRSVQAQIPELQSRMGPEEQATEQLRHLGEENNQMAARLRLVLERTQARDLAHLVQSEEEAAQSTIQQQIAQGKFDHVQSWRLARELADLQAKRQQTVDEIVKLYSQAGSGKHMDDYRRLIALSCGAEPNEVDSLLDGIEQALEEKQ